jgi:ABC-type transport system involved in multi-copper enzyme maturation permease subunit
VIDALRYEWVRIRTIRSTYWISAVAVLVGVGLSFLISMGTSFELADHPAELGEIEFLAPAIVTQFAAVAGPYLVAYILVIVGVLTWGHEYRHGMIRATLTANGSRTAVWVAKYVVLGIWAVAMALAILLMSTLVGWLWLQDDGIEFGTAELVQQVARALSYAVLFIWVGAAVSSVIRNQTAALVTVFIWPLAVEPILGLIIKVIPGLDSLENVAKWFPFNAGDRIIRSTEVGQALDAALGGTQLSTMRGYLIFGGFTAGVMALSYVLFRKRDA